MVIRPAQQGLVLIPVLTSLAIIAAVVHLVSKQQGMLAHSNAKQLETAVANAVAEAGLRDALWRARTSTSYPNPVTGALPGHGAYQASITKDPLDSSKITIISVGTTANNIQANLKRTYKLSCTTTTTTKVNSYEVKPVAIAEANLLKDHLAVDNNLDHKGTSNRARSVIKFAPTAFPPAGVKIVSATLQLDVAQHDLAMEGGTLYANRLLRAFDSGVSWQNATSLDAWDTAGGDFTLVNEGTTTIANTTVYNIEIKDMVDGWINGGLTNNGLLLRTNVPSSEPAHKLRFKSNTPRILVVHC